MPWPLPTCKTELLALAKSYPFEDPGASYLLRDGAAAPLAPHCDVFAGRVAVIAHGSNRSPAQLRRKFGEAAEIPVTRAWLADYDVVYSAHVTQYGAIAANLRHAPGVRTCVFVTWLTAVQLTRMHATELGGENYHYGVMERIDLALEVGPAGGLCAAQVYLSTRGCVAAVDKADGRPLALAAVEARGRAHAEVHQHGAQEVVRGRHRAHEDLDDFILRNVRDQARRRALIAEMRAHSIPAAAPHFRTIQV